MSYYTVQSYPTKKVSDMAFVGLGQTEQPSAISALLSPVTGILTEQAQKIADPLVAKIQPMIREELERQVPTFGIYAGLAMGALVVIGILTGVLTTKQRFAGGGR